MFGFRLWGTKRTPTGPNWVTERKTIETHRKGSPCAARVYSVHEREHQTLLPPVSELLDNVFGHLGPFLARFWTQAGPGRSRPIWACGGATWVEDVRVSAKEDP